MKRKILIGLKSISYILNVSDETIIKYMRDYDSFPVRKIRGSYTAEEKQLISWWVAYCNGTLGTLDLEQQIRHLLMFYEISEIEKMLKTIKKEFTEEGKKKAGKYL